MCWLRRGTHSSAQDLVQKLIARHLTDKSKGRVENVFGFYGGGAAAQYTNRAHTLQWRCLTSCTRTRRTRVRSRPRDGDSRAAENIEAVMKLLNQLSDDNKL